MKNTAPCVRGTFPRLPDKYGRCRCEPCKEVDRARRRANPRAEYQRAWNAANQDRLAEYSRRFAAAHPEKRRASEAKWRRANPDKVALHNAKGGKKWTENNRGARNAITQARRSAKLQRTPAWADMAAIKAFYVAAALLTAETGIPHEVDHFYPLQGKQVSGLHVEGNLQILTRRANRAKHNRPGAA